MLIRNINTFFQETRNFLRIFNGIMKYVHQYTNKRLYNKALQKLNL